MAVNPKDPRKARLCGAAFKPARRGRPPVMNVPVHRLSALAMVGLLAAILPLGQATADQPVSQAQRVLVTSPSTGLFEMGFVVAQRRGYYAEEGLDVTRVQMAPSVSVAAV